jgi:hypothetical protein
MQYVVRISPCKNRSWLAEIRSLRGVMAFNELQVQALRTVEALARDVLGDRGEPFAVLPRGGASTWQSHCG